ncbi:hypothetical protein [Myxococcus xanthus]|uniref:hypothetical protein n=1 Tax=Myxococcus xanthus TaxID=34 RepID=UPI00148C1AD4|nr:hypothetical protein [Myxococcus xanthus]NOJ90953.1 hypothetical protein [Myxococcus xanthus]
MEFPSAGPLHRTIISAKTDGELDGLILHAVTYEPLSQVSVTVIRMGSGDS